MIRQMVSADIPAVVEMVGELRLAAGQPQDVEPERTAATLQRLIGSAWVVDFGGPVGFLAAEIVQSAISGERIAIEHGWYCRASGWGLRLLGQYEAWAAAEGCRRVRMSAPVNGPVRGILERRGYEAVEIAMVRTI